MTLFLTICLLFVLPLSISAANFMCYYPSYATYFPGTNSYPPGRIDPSLCAHLFYAFDTLDQTTNEITAQDPSVGIDQQGFSSFTAIKLKNKTLKTLTSLGGVSDSNDGTGKYSKLVSNTANIKTFVNSVMKFLPLYGFGGLDLDWEVPSGAADKAGFTQLAQALRTALNPKGYLLSAALPSDTSQIIDVVSSNIQWVGYDDPAFSTVKANYALAKGLGGTMVWDPTQDDLTCVAGVNPMLKAISKVMLGSKGI